MLWNRKYQEFDLVVSSVTTKVKGVAQTRLPGVGQVVWDTVDYSGSPQVGDSSSVQKYKYCWENDSKSFLLLFLGQKLLLCGDQRYYDEESEAGKMCRGALNINLQCFCFLLFLAGNILHKKTKNYLQTKNHHITVEKYREEIKTFSPDFK